MKKIESIYLYRANNGAHFQFMSFIAARAEADAQVSEKASAEVAALRATLAIEDTNLKLTTKSLITDEIAEADKARDDYFRLYRRIVKGNVGHPVKSIAGAAKILAQHLKDYKIDPHMQLDRETGLLTNLVSDLEGSYESEVEALGLTTVVPLIKEANKRVEAALESRTEESMTRAVGALKAARAASDAAYAALVQKVNALAVVEGDAAYADFIDYVNTQITRYRREVLGQKTESSTGTTTTTPTTDDSPVVDDGTDTGGTSEEDIPEVM